LGHNGRIFLDIYFVGEGKISLKKPRCEIAVSAQGKPIQDIIVKNIINASEEIKSNYNHAKEQDKFGCIGKTKKIKKEFISAGVNHIGV
jgi:hypothetical protein